MPPRRVGSQPLHPIYALLIVIGAVGVLFAGFTGAAAAIVMVAVVFVLVQFAGGVLDGLEMRWLWKTRPAAAYCMTCQ